MTKPPETQAPDNDAHQKAERIMDAARRAVRAAVREHKLLGNPIVGWRDGKTVLIAPEDIEL